jgi:2-phosphoglycerate kinase
VSNCFVCVKLEAIKFCHEVFVTNHPFANVLFLGGATDSGKTTVAQELATRNGGAVYHYDRSDVPHHRRLAQTKANYAEFMNASLEENWLKPSPAALAARAMQSFQDRWAFVLEDLQAVWLPAGRFLIAEGFGLTPELLVSKIINKHQAIFLFPSEKFKQDSMTRRNKGSFGGQISDPTQARENLFRRDLLLSEDLRQQAIGLGLRTLEVDGTQSVDEVTDIVEQHFKTYIEP